MQTMMLKASNMLPVCKLTMTPQVLMYVSLRSRPNVATKEQMAYSEKLSGTLWSIGVLLAASGAYKSNFLMI